MFEMFFHYDSRAQVQLTHHAANSSGTANNAFDLRYMNGFHCWAYFLVRIVI